MSNLIPPIVVGLGVAVSAYSIVAVAGPVPGPPASRSAQDDGTPADPAPAVGSAEAPPLSQAPLPVGTGAESGPPGQEPQPSRTVLLMKDGKVRSFDGSAVEDRGDFVVRMQEGEVRVPADRVEGRFGSLREAYEYQRDHLPDRDPDEHLRLARWCLTQGMEGEAAEQLRALLSWSPGDSQAADMLKALEASVARREAAVDSGVVRTGGESVGGGGAAASGMAPRDLDVSVLGQIRAYKGPVARPQIFGLPEALAVRRFQDFGNGVHRVLQSRCASCHDEESDRNFRLVRARDPKDLRNSLLVRTNLDATLGLVDPSNPGHSPLLINAVMPHGPDQKPILPNSNSAEYRALWTWIESLRGESAPAPAAASAPMTAPMPAAAPAPMAPGVGLSAPMPNAAADPAFGGGFATQRAGPVAAAAPPPMAAPAPGGVAPAMTPYPHVINQQVQMDATYPGVPADLDFQTVSPLLGPGNAAGLTVGGQPVAPPGSAPAPAGVVPAPGQPRQPQAPQGSLFPPGFIPPPGSMPTAPAPPPAPGAVAPPPGGVPAPAPASPNAAPGQPGVVQQLPDGTQILAQPDGSKMMRLPTGELLPFMDKTDVNGQAPATGGKTGVQIDPALLEKLQKRRNGGQ
ncbi:hypothetical protein [Tautonia plasticadhaerens]|uniref:Cytochrome c domain-containing protein n=1 Tax=Tautonia plasticadhaerens TaxID=2527974 RepID=A0A518H2P0_9BACT|nr:hypothetical protein [Tautonia plasticadhaerens]QDV35116.1 hypothetical protein ElP_30180 [Tautonia plasticadhaerens]